MIKALAVFFSIIPMCLFAQNQHGDCGVALHLNEASITIHEVNGPGEIIEFQNNDLSDSKYFTEEHNTVWISFNAASKGELTFSIIPKDSKDDWDFVLFKTSPSSCQEIADKSLLPIRSNLARNDEQNAGITGLNDMAENAFVAAGPNPNMSKYLDVKAGEQFIIVIDILEANQQGFEFKWEVNEEEEIFIEESRTEESSFAFMDMTDSEGSSELIKINFEVFLEGTEIPVNCYAEVVGVQWTAENMIFEDQNKFSVEIPKEKWFFMNVKKQGYTFATEKYKASAEISGITQKIYITEASIGKHIVLTEIVFRENTTQFLPSSINALDQLINFMKDYPKAHIEVQGHVNAPDRENDSKVKKFSLKRAEQIKTYLVDSGIDGRRIQVAGMGNEFMIYPDPQNYDQEKANRRVEIEILSL